MRALVTGTDVSVHPRVCGEQILLAAAIVVLGGSSPRVRGTDGPGGEREDERRFIPACAGNRRSKDGAGYNMLGSSPRVRGTGNQGSVGQA